MNPDAPHTTPVVGRFAPSPTGPLHVGSLVAAVGSFVLARRAGGRWLVRMEDLDTPRVISGMGEDILRTLEQLSLTWDGPVVWQSQRTEAYREAMERLREAGWAYPCGCSRAEIRQAASAPHPGEEGPIYPGTCRAGLAPGRTARAHRLRVPEAPIAFTDLIQGPQSWNLAECVGDFVIHRADGVTAYQLAVVVDDAAAAVTQVARGADLLSSTPRQIHLQRLLGFATPEYAHLPLVTGPGGEKLSKRDNAVSLGEGCDLARDGGRLIAASLVFLGQEVPSELARAPAAEVIAWALAHFDPRRIPARAHPWSPR